MDDANRLKEVLEATAAALEAEREAHRHGQALWAKTQERLEAAESARQRLLSAFLKAEGCENLPANCPGCGSSGSIFDACLVHEAVYDDRSVFDDDGPPQVIGRTSQKCTNPWHKAKKRLPEIMELAAVSPK